MAVISGEHAAERDRVEDAVLAFGPQLFGLALSITGNRADAEDAYQAGWLDAIGAWDGLRDSTRRRAWLATVIARRALGQRRRRRLLGRRETDLGRAAELGTEMSWDPGLGARLDALSPRQRAVLTLHYGHGYSLDEVAGILGCGGGSVRSHLHRALVRLRREEDSR